MKKCEKTDSLVSIALAYLAKQGYTDLRRIENERNGDIIILAHLDAPCDGKVWVFVEVMDASKVRFIPLNGLGRSAKAKAKLARLISIAHGMDGDDHTIRLDALWIDKGEYSSFSSISHIKSI